MFDDIIMLKVDSSIEIFKITWQFFIYIVIQI